MPLAARLEVNQPIGNHGDMVLDLPLPCSNDDELRRRLFHHHATTQTTKPKHDALVRERLESFLVASKAAKSGDPQAARTALQKIVEMEKENSNFSLMGDFAELALKKLDDDLSGVDAEKELKKRSRIRSVKVVVSVFMVPGIIASSLDDPSAALASLWIMPMLLAPFMACWLCTLRRRDSDARQLVDELYEIASLDERKSLLKETA